MTEVIPFQSQNLVALRDGPADDDYGQFSETRKRIMVATVGFLCFLAPFSIAAILPAVPNVASQFNTTGTVINYTNAGFLMTMAISPCFCAPLSQIYGRRPTYLIAIGLFFFASIGTAVSNNLAAFVVCRCLTALGGMAFLVVGSGTIGDIYTPTRRGKAMGFVLSGTQLGPGFGPFVGGVIITYQAWRIIFWVQAALGGLGLILIIIFLPETIRQRRLDDIRLIKGKNVHFVPINPLRPIALFRYPNLLLTGIASGTVVFSMYSLLTPIRYVLDPRFNLTTPLQAGLFYLPPGVGFFLGTFIGGSYADIITRQWIKKRGGKRIPEDRLRAGLIPFFLMLPGTVLIYGWSVETQKGGIAVPVIAMFFNAFSQMVVFPSVNTYCTEVMPMRSAEVIGSKYFMQFMFSGAATASCLPMIQKIGVGWTSTISAGVLLMGASMVWLVIHFGVRMQNWAINFMVRGDRVSGKTGNSIVVVRDTLGPVAKGENLDLEVQDDRVPEK